MAPTGDAPRPRNSILAARPLENTSPRPGWDCHQPGAWGQAELSLANGMGPLTDRLATLTAVQAGQEILLSPPGGWTHNPLVRASAAPKRSIWNVIGSSAILRADQQVIGSALGARGPCLPSVTPCDWELGSRGLGGSASPR